MIRDVDIGIVIQGDIRKCTPEVIRSARSAFPGSTILLSTYRFAGAMPDTMLEMLDGLVASDDPGGLPSTVISPTAPQNNINRQIVTTQAGLKLLETPYVLKLRSDTTIAHRGVVDAWETEARAAGRGDRISVPHLYTRHPDGINGYLFHPSDWVQFGRREDVASFWDAELMPEAVARWYETRRHEPGATATARRFRARMTQEQWLATQYAQRLGYEVPEYLHQRTQQLSKSCRQFFGRHLQILDTPSMGITLQAHSWALSSLFQKLDCVSNRDWHRLCRAEASRAQVDPLRMLARKARYPIAKGVLVRKWIKGRLASTGR